MKSIRALFLTLSFLGSANAALVTNQITGKIALLGYGAPELIAISGQSFTALLSYDTSLEPTSVWEPHFSNYEGAGELSFSTSLGGATSKGMHLQTFLFGGKPGNGSNFSGFGSNAQLSGAWAKFNLESIDFQFASSPYGGFKGLTGFNLPNPLVSDNFDNGNFVRLVFSVQDESGEKPNLVGLITSVSAVPEPETYALLLAGMGLIGAVLRRRKNKGQAH